MTLPNLRPAAACALVLGILTTSGATAAEPTETPLAVVGCVVPLSAQPAFIARLRRFATRNSIALELSDSQQSSRVSVQAWRQDILIVGDNATTDESFLFKLHAGNPRFPPADSLVQRVARDLRVTLGEIARCRS